MMRVRSTLDWSQSNNILCLVFIIMIIIFVLTCAGDWRHHSQLAVTRPGLQFPLVIARFVHTSHHSYRL